MRSAASVSSNSLEQLRGAAPRPRGGTGRTAADQHEVLAAGEELVEGGVLAGDADDAAHRGGLGDHVVAGHPGRAAVGAGHGGEHADGGGLAGAVGAEHAEDAARRDLEVDAGDGHVLAVALAELPPRSWGLAREASSRGVLLAGRSRAWFRPDLPYGKLATYRSSSNIGGQ